MVLQKIALFLNTIAAYFLLSLIAVFVVIPIVCLLLILPKKWMYQNKLLFTLLHLGYGAIVRSTLMPFKIYNKENLPKGAAIYIANHQSALDIPVLGYLVGPKPHVWYVLDIYANKWGLHFFVKSLGISVTQEESAHAARALINGIKRAEEYHQSSLIFPEGGRYNDETVHPFFGGFALLARKTEQAVVPLYFKNLGKILPPHTGVLAARLPIEVIVGPLYYYEKDETDEQFVHRIHTWFEEQSQ